MFGNLFTRSPTGPTDKKNPAAPAPEAPKVDTAKPASTPPVPDPTKRSSDTPAAANSSAPIPPTPAKAEEKPAPQRSDESIPDLKTLRIDRSLAPPTVLGTPGYIAPEVVAGKKLPSIETDQHALAVLLYETLLQRHPLHGPKIHTTRSAEEDDLLMMGARALYMQLTPALKVLFSLEPGGRLGVFNFLKR